MTDGIFDASIAPRYDASCPEMFEPAVLGPTVDLLVDLADGGRALELAVGTGRVGLALAERGVEVHGIELSRSMVEQLRAKPGGEGLAVTIGDMATTRLDARFRLVYLVYNTISNLLTQREQVTCFANAAAHLEPGGRFLVEVGIPPVQRLPVGERFVAFEVTAHHVGIDEVDLVEQLLVSHHHWIDGDRVSVFDSTHRYAWPAEYDLMAQLAGLVLEARWSDWHRSPFTAESTAHVSVWRQPPAQA